MSELWEPVDQWDSRLELDGDGILAEFNRQGVLTSADVHVARRVCALVGTDEPADQLGLALAVRAVRHGSVCVDLGGVMAQLGDLPWPLPTPEGWLARLQRSPLAAQILRFEGSLIYLDRYHQEEGQIRDDLITRIRSIPPQLDAGALAAHADQLFPEAIDREQRDAAVAAASQWTTVITGGPGTGKTTTVKRLLELLEADRPGTLRIALTAPTGKAAARLQESVGRSEVDTSTLHRLLGWQPGSRTRFKHHRGNKLSYDVIVVDETSMVPLTMMARLLEAVRSDARLILVGDPDQLASVEAGAVLADLVGGLRPLAPQSVAHLSTSRRFGSEIGDLAEAIRVGDGDRALELFEGPSKTVELVDPNDDRQGQALQDRLTRYALDLHYAAKTGNVEEALRVADEHRLLCPHRDGPAGAAYWNRKIEGWLAAELGLRALTGWYVGRPILITANDYGLDLFNGDTGVVLPGRHGAGPEAIIAGPSRARLATSRLSQVETMHAMTVHKAQGSQAQVVTVMLPTEESMLATRELFYTAVTRAQQRVVVVGTSEAVRSAIARRAQRASGLVDRLRA